MHSTEVEEIFVVVWTELGAEGYSVAVGLPPVVLFVGLSVLGCLPRSMRWWFTLLWLGACWGGSLVFVMLYL